LKADKIVYSNTCKEPKDLIYAAKRGVNLTTADTLGEIQKIQKYAPKMDILWRIAIKEDNADDLACSFSHKFGDDLNSIKDAE